MHSTFSPDANKQGKRYFWIKLKNDFFNWIEMRKMRNEPNGAYLTIIYLKMLLLSLETNGALYFQEIGDDLVDEIVFCIDEDRNHVIECINFCNDKNLTSPIEGGIYFNRFCDMVGSESFSAERMRRHRSKKRQAPS